MSRDIGGNPVTDDRGVSVYLLRISYWDGAAPQEIRFTDAPVSLSVDVGAPGGAETWVGTGILVGVSNVTEGTDLDATAVNITFDGVDTSIIAIILGNQFRSQPIEIWKVWYDPDDATIAGTPLLYFRGYQNDPYSVGESSTDLPDAVQVGTRCISLITRTNAENTVLSNPQSHLNMLERGGLADATANFWTWVPAIVDLAIYWGENPPSPPNGPYQGPTGDHYYPIPGSGAGAGPYG